MSSAETFDIHFRYTVCSNLRPAAILTLTLSIDLDYINYLGPYRPNANACDCVSLNAG